MKVSIITVVYNNKATLENAITSVLSQKYNNIEYIIIDGQSTDGTLDIITKHLSQINVFISEPDKGLYDAMNKGIKNATGDIIGILNSDDIYEDDDVIGDVVAQFNNGNGVDMVYGDLVYVKADDINKIVRKWKSKQYYKRFFERGNVPPHPGLFVKKTVYDKCGLFDINYKLAADYDFMLRAFTKFGQTSRYFTRRIVRMRLGGATNKSTKNIVDGNKEIIDSWKKNGLKVPLLLMPYRIVKRLIQFI